MCRGDAFCYGFYLKLSSLGISEDQQEVVAEYADKVASSHAKTASTEKTAIEPLTMLALGWGVKMLGGWALKALAAKGVGAAAGAAGAAGLKGLAAKAVASSPAWAAHGAKYVGGSLSSMGQWGLMGQGMDMITGGGNDHDGSPDYYNQAQDFPQPPPGWGGGPGQMAAPMDMGGGAGQFEPPQPPGQQSGNSQDGLWRGANYLSSGGRSAGNSSPFTGQSNQGQHRYGS